MAKGKNFNWKGRQDGRDDTPTFIKNADSRDQILGTQRPGTSFIPVLEIPRHIKIWHKVRWPLFLFILIVVLSAIGYFTNDFLVSRNVEQRITDSFIGEESAHIQVLQESNRVLKNLANRYTDRSNVQSAYAWNCVLLAKLFDDSELYLEESKDIFQSIKSDTSFFSYAARAGKYVLTNDLEKAKKILTEALLAYPEEPRIKFVNTWYLEKTGETLESQKALSGLREKHPDYLPPLFTLIDLGIKKNDVRTIAQYSAELLSASTGNLFGSLSALYVRLPQWNGEPLAKDELNELISSADAIKQRMEDIPSKFVSFLDFIYGKIALQKSNPEEAVAIFSKILTEDYGLDAPAWYAKAVFHKEGPYEALKALEKIEGDQSDAVLDLRTRCYLELYQIMEAQLSFDILKERSSMNLDQLEWMLAVRKGDTNKALEKLPKINETKKLLALELYEQLLENGNREGISKLISSMEDHFKDCANVISLWHSNRIVALLHNIKKPESCTMLFALRVMLFNLTPEELTEIRKKIETVNISDYRLQIDLALAIWKTEGMKKAQKILEDLLAKPISSAPLKAALGRAFFQMGLYDQAISAVSELEYAQGVSILIESYKEQKKNIKAQKALAGAMQNVNLKNHPAIIFHHLSEKIQTENYDEIIDAVDEIMPRAGNWSARFAWLKAQAMSQQGKRGDADRYLLSIARNSVDNGGINQSWQARKGIIDLNIRRGGAYLFKAVSTALELYRTQINDPEVIFIYGSESLRQGNQRGALRYFNESIAIDPTFVPPYEKLAELEELTEEQRQKLKLFRPNVKL